MDKADQVLTQLLVRLCNYSYCSRRVLYDLFQEEKYNIMLEVQEAYTEKEIKYIEQRMVEYDFPTFIQSIVYEDTMLLD